MLQGVAGCCQTHLLDDFKYAVVWGGSRYVAVCCIVLQ